MIHPAAYGSPADKCLALLVARVTGRKIYRDLLRCILNPPVWHGERVEYWRITGPEL